MGVCKSPNGELCTGRTPPTTCWEAGKYKVIPAPAPHGLELLFKPLRDQPLPVDERKLVPRARSLGRRRSLPVVGSERSRCWRSVPFAGAQGRPACGCPCHATRDAGFRANRRQRHPALRAGPWSRTSCRVRWPPHLIQGAPFAPHSVKVTGRRWPLRAACASCFTSTSGSVLSFCRTTVILLTQWEARHTHTHMGKGVDQRKGVRSRAPRKDGRTSAGSWSPGSRDADAGVRSTELWRCACWESPTWSPCP